MGGKSDQTVPRASGQAFVYDGDGNRVKGTIGTAITIYIGNYLEWTGSTGTMKKYYYAGGVRIAMRTGSNNPLWLLGDHLGSTSKVANFDGLSVQSQQLYKPWGEKRYPTGAPTLPTTFRYTGQRSETGLGPSGGEGLMFYNARWYDPALGRFIQADSIVPGGVQGLDRYAYNYNNPVKYIDPSGH
jgi:RHS repeat-associated protein